MPSLMPPLLGIRALKDIADFSAIPAIAGVLGVASVILEDIQALKSNNTYRDALARQIVEAVLAIHEQLSLAAKQNIPIPDEVLCATEGTKESLLRISEQLKSQQARGAVSRFIRKSADADLLKGCREDLQRAMEIYFLQANIFMQRATTALASPKTWDASYMPPPPTSRQQLADQPQERTIGHRLPPPPHLLFGRDEVVAEAVQWLCPLPSRPAAAASSKSAPSGVSDITTRHLNLLGAPGIGKSSVVRAVFHHHQVLARFTRRVHIDCAAHFTLVAVLNSLGVTKNQLLASLRIDASEDEHQTLLLLDAVDTLFAKDQLAIETFLPQLLGIPNVSVLIAARGAGTPVLMPKDVLKRIVLPPLDDTASKHLYASIADRDADSATIQKADGHPLALTLLAHQPEGQAIAPSSSLEPEQIEEDRLNAVISTSVDLLNQDAKDCLAILARAPDGLARHLLPNSRGVTSLLCSALASQRRKLAAEQPAPTATSLPPTDPSSNNPPSAEEGGCIHALTPIRAYALRHLKPPPAALHELRRYYFELAQRALEIGTAQTTLVIDILKRESGNLARVVSEAVREGGPDVQTSHSTNHQHSDWRDGVRSIIALELWQQWTGNMDGSLVSVCLQRLKSIPEDEMTPVDYALLSECQITFSRTMPPARADGRQLADAALDSARKAEDVGLEIDALTRRSVSDTQLDLSRLERAVQLLSFLQEADPKTPRRKARVYLELGQLHISSSNVDLARKYFGLAKDLTPQLSNMIQLRARALCSYGHTCVYANQPRQAARAYSQALTESEAIGSSIQSAHCISYLASLCERRGQWDEARGLWDETSKRYSKFGLQMDWTLAKCGAMRVACQRVLENDRLQRDGRGHLILGEVSIPELPPMPSPESGWDFGRGAVFLAMAYQALAHAILTAAPQADSLPAAPMIASSSIASTSTSTFATSLSAVTSDTASFSGATVDTDLTSPESATSTSAPGQPVFHYPPKRSTSSQPLDEDTLESFILQLEDAREFGFAARMAFRKRRTKTWEANCEVFLAQVALVAAQIDTRGVGYHKAGGDHFIVALLLLRSCSEGLLSAGVLRRWLGSELIQ
ncbi:hypothetical protein BKA62DRAFT_693429 [Auriculariales sp. MPI-PUGE-AT-0066]|nr:hypothetical protein BKA62DRAFT_693429 [Auriculariales sp. MPI-PUGE-AT-0066]